MKHNLPICSFYYKCVRSVTKFYGLFPACKNYHMMAWAVTRMYCLSPMYSEIPVCKFSHRITGLCPVCRSENKCVRTVSRFYFLAHRTRISASFTWTDNSFLALRIIISACFTWTDNSYLNHVITPRTG